LYDAEIIAGSPQRFERHPQKFPSRAIAVRERHLINGTFEQSGPFITSRQMIQEEPPVIRDHKMASEAERDAETGRAFVRAPRYVPLSTSPYQHYQEQHKSAIRCHAATYKLHITVTLSDHDEVNFT
jgi:hypothetical protein